MIRLKNVIKPFKNSQSINLVILYYDATPIVSDRYRIVDIDPMTSRRYRGNFYGLLKHLQVDSRFYMITLHLNQLSNPVQWDGIQTQLKVANDSNLNF